MIYKKWKIILFFVVATLFIGLNVFIMSQYKSELTISTLHEKTGTECIEILQEYGLELAPVYQNDPKLAEESVKTIIDDIYINGLKSDGIAYSYTEMNDLAKQIIHILNESNIK